MNDFRTCLVALLAAVSISALSACATVRDYDTGPVDNQAASTLFVPYQFEVVAIDDTTLNDNFMFFDGRDQTLTLAPGQHTLVLRYFDLIDDRESHTNSYVRVLSEPITVVFTTRPGTDFRVVGAPPETPAAGRDFARAPALHIETANRGERIAVQVAVAEAEPTQQSDPASAGHQEPAPVPPTAGAGGTRAYDMLEYWWNQASAAQRERFDQWRRKQ